MEPKTALFTYICLSKYTFIFSFLGIFNNQTKEPIFHAKYYPVMKSYTLLSLLILLSLQIAVAFPSSGVSKDSTSKMMIDGNEIVLEKIIEGKVALYRQAYQDEDLFETLGILSPAYETKYRYFIGGEEIKAIDGGNYKKLIRQYLKNAPELHNRLGRNGFRFKNLPSMIMYYNRFKAGRATEQFYDPREAILTMIK